MMKSYFFVAVLLLSCKLPAQLGRDSADALYSSYLESWNNSQFIESIAYLEEILNNNFDVEKTYYAYIHNNLGRAYWKLGRLQLAKEQYQLATEVCLDTDLSNSTLLSSIYNNIALIYDQQTLHNIAIELFNKSERILNDHKGNTSIFYSRIASIYLNRGISYYNLGKYPLAINNLEKSREIKESRNLSYLGSVLFNLARCFQALGNYQEADQYFLASISQWISETDSNHYQLANIYLDYGQFLGSLGDTSSAITYFDKSLSICIEKYGEIHPYTSNCYDHIARYYLELEDFESSLMYIQQSLISICPTFSNSSFNSNPTIEEPIVGIDLLKNLRIKFQVLKKILHTHEGLVLIEGKYYSSIDVLELLFEIFDLEINLLTTIQSSYPDQESRLFLDNNQKDIFIDGIEIAHLLYEITKDEQYIKRAFSIAAQGKSLEFQHEFREKQNLYLESLQDPLAVQILEIKEDIASYQNTIRLEQQKLMPDSSLILMWTDTVFHLKRSYEQKSEELWGKNESSYYLQNGIDSNHLALTQSKLRNKETLIEYALSNNSDDGFRRMYSFVITKNDCHLYESKLDNSFDQDIDIVRQHLKLQQYINQSTANSDTLYQALNRLYKVLFYPIEQWISNDQLIVVPDEELVLLPFDALISGEYLNRQKQPPSLDFLVNDYSISYVLNSQLLPGRNSLKLRSPGILAFGGNSSESNNQALIGADDEISSILELFKGERITTGIGKDSVLNLISDRSIVHFALHSYSEDQTTNAAYLDFNPLDDSFLGNQLYDFEIGSQRILSPMVVLSSCESGSGRLYSGEGAMSLSRSFLLAGSESVVHTLWPVEDKTSSLIMKDYYKGLKRAWNKSKSLQRAKLKYLENASPTFHHPHYWAGYQISGSYYRLRVPRIIMVGVAIVCFTLITLLLTHLRRRTRKQ